MRQLVVIYKISGAIITIEALSMEILVGAGQLYLRLP